MNMKQSNVVLFVKNEFRSHHDFPMIGSFNHRGKSPLIVIEKFHSKAYIGNLIDSLSLDVTEKESAFATLLILFTVTMGPLTTFRSKEQTV